MTNLKAKWQIRLKEKKKKKQIHSNDVFLPEDQNQYESILSVIQCDKWIAFSVAQSLGDLSWLLSRLCFMFFNYVLQWFLQFLLCYNLFPLPSTIPGCSVLGLLSLCCKSQGDLAHKHELIFHLFDTSFPIVLLLYHEKLQHQPAICTSKIHKTNIFSPGILFPLSWWKNWKQYKNSY